MAGPDRILAWIEPHARDTMSAEMRRLFPRWMILTALIGIGALSILAAVWLSFRKDWIRPVEGVSLEPELPLRTEMDFGEDSGYRLLVSACDALKASGWKTSYSSASSRTTLLWAQGMTSDLPQEPLELARRAAEAPGGRVPSVTSPFAPQPFLSRTLQLSRLLEASAARKAAQGDPEGALEDLDAALRIGSLVSRGGLLVNHLVGLSCHGTTLQGVRLCALRSHLPKETLKGAQARLSALEKDLPTLAESLRQEALACSSSVPMIYTNPKTVLGTAPPLPTSLLGLVGSHPETTARNLASVYTHVLDEVGKPYDPKTRDAFMKTTFNRSPWKIALLKDPVGYLLAAMMIPSSCKVRVADLKRQAQLRATRAVLAILAFRTETGRLPGSLDDLCPGFLPEVPKDPFDGKPLRFARQEDAWKVYSVGENAADDGGMDPADLVFPGSEFEDLPRPAKP